MVLKLNSEQNLERVVEGKAVMFFFSKIHVYVPDMVEVVDSQDLR